MDLPMLHSYKEAAIDTVVYVINKAVDNIGVRQNLSELARCRSIVASQVKICLKSLQPPLAINSEELIARTIERKWYLTEIFKYCLKYRGSSSDEYSNYFYYEAIFSQPTAAYPIPQATASVFFRVQDKQTDPPEERRTPIMVFRIEGHHKDHDVRYVTLTADWILAVIQMKIKFFKRIEQLSLF